MTKITLEELADMIRVPVAEVPGNPGAAGWERTLQWARDHKAEIRPDYAGRPSFSIVDAYRIGLAETKAAEEWAAKQAAQRAAEHEAWRRQSDYDFKASVVGSPEWQAARNADQERLQRERRPSIFGGLSFSRGGE